MSTKTWLLASIAISLTVGYGTRILDGDAGPADGTRLANVEEAALEDAVDAVWTHPGITVVMKVPAKEAVTQRSATGAALVVNNDSARGRAALATYTHPGLTVVVKVPSRAEQAPAVDSVSWANGGISDGIQLEKVTSSNDSSDEVRGQSREDGRDIEQGEGIRVPSAPEVDVTTDGGNAEEVAPQLSDPEQPVSMPRIQS